MFGRHVQEGVVVLHETIYDLHRNEMAGVISEIDFEKAYDKVKWFFLQQVMCMKSFKSKLCKWIATFVQGGSVRIRVNDDIDYYLQTRFFKRKANPMQRYWQFALHGQRRMARYGAQPSFS
jgi:hypothetical protein